MVMKTAITKKAFTLVEIILVVAILGILAALIFPVFQNDVTKAKEAAARESLRIVRNVIELYAAQHNGVPPGYPGDDMSQSPGDQALFVAQMVGAGKYLKSLPDNPFDLLTTNILLLNIIFLLNISLIVVLQFLLKILRQFNMYVYPN